METILVNYEGHVATITINRPKALNALSTQVLTELNEALNEVEANKDVYALIITGAVSYTHLDVYKRQTSDDHKHGGI